MPRLFRSGLAVLLALAAVSPALARKAVRAEAPSPFRAARGAESAGPRNPAFDAVLDRRIARTRGGANLLVVDPRVFVRAQKAIVSRDLAARPDGATLPSRTGPAPVALFATFFARLEGTFRNRLGLEAEVAAALAAEMEAQALAEAGVAREAYLAALGAARPEAAARRMAAARALDILWRESRVDTRFQVPYVAGYARDDAAYVFIDCAVPLEATLGGARVPVGALLTLHERVEKAILADHATTYPSAHQIALRLEMLAAKGAGVVWTPYDDLIGRVSSAIDGRKRVRISDRLDLQPYYTFTDAPNLRLVAAMKRGTVAQPALDAARGADLDPRPACAGNGRPPARPAQGSSTVSQ
ncbi:MAG: hypothetical protein IPL88_03030 [Rhizobiales bacterium]|nr:hypothetical protein [Hyphomicrobiales bacterium]